MPRRASSSVPATGGGSRLGAVGSPPAAARSAVRAASNATLPAADDDDALAEVDPEALVDVEEELDRSQHAVELVAREVEVAAPAGADREEQCVVPAEQLLERRVAADPERSARHRCRARGSPRSRGR